MRLTVKFKVAYHVWERIIERSFHSLAKTQPEESLQHDMKNIVSIYRYTSKGKKEIRVFTKEKRQYRLALEPNGWIVVTMVQHNARTFATEIKLAKKLKNNKAV